LALRPAPVLILEISFGIQIARNKVALMILVIGN
jgi:hypothetical protein